MPPRRIDVESLSDARLEPFRDVRDKDLRGSERLFMAESEMVLRRLLRRPERLHALLLSPQKLDDLLSKKFEEAKKKAEKDPDKKPHRPFDFD